MNARLDICTACGKALTGATRQLQLGARPVKPWSTAAEVWGLA